MPDARFRQLKHDRYNLSLRLHSGQALSEVERIGNLGVVNEDERSSYGLLSGDSPLSTILRTVLNWITACLSSANDTTADTALSLPPAGTRASF